MKFTHYTALAALAVTLGSNSALAADASSAAPAQGQSTASKDFGKLSTDGAKAFRDLRMARVAILTVRSTKQKDLPRMHRPTSTKRRLMTRSLPRLRPI